jgi:hypothetical protein
MANVSQSVIDVIEHRIAVRRILAQHCTRFSTSLTELDDGADEPYDCLNVTCPYDFFKCSSSGKCIPLEKVCDNFDDCPPAEKAKGGSDDETPQACSRSPPSD